MPKNPAKNPQWRSVFQNPDVVGQSEYRALVELLADASGIPNCCGEVHDPETEITKEARDHMLSILSETVDQARAMRKDLKQLKFARR